MRIRHVGMAVTLWLVPVLVAMRAFGHGVVVMVVVAVVMVMRVLVLQRLVLMFMVV